MSEQRSPSGLQAVLRSPQALKTKSEGKCAVSRVALPQTDEIFVPQTLDAELTILGLN